MSMGIITAKECQDKMNTKPLQIGDVTPYGLLTDIRLTVDVDGVVHSRLNFTYTGEETFGDFKVRVFKHGPSEPLTYENPSLDLYPRPGDVEASGNEGCAVDFWLPEKTGSSRAGLVVCVVLVWLAAVAVWLW